MSLFPCRLSWLCAVPCPGAGMVGSVGTLGWHPTSGQFGNVRGCAALGDTSAAREQCLASAAAQDWVHCKPAPSHLSVLPGRSLRVDDIRLSGTRARAVLQGGFNCRVQLRCLSGAVSEGSPRDSTHRSHRSGTRRLKGGTRKLSRPAVVDSVKTETCISFHTSTCLTAPVGCRAEGHRLLVHFHGSGAARLPVPNVGPVLLTRALRNPKHGVLSQREASCNNRWRQLTLGAAQADAGRAISGTAIIAQLHERSHEGPATVEVESEVLTLVAGSVLHCQRQRARGTIKGRTSETGLSLRSAPPPPRRTRPATHAPAAAFAAVLIPRSCTGRDKQVDGVRGLHFSLTLHVRSQKKQKRFPFGCPGCSALWLLRVYAWRPLML